jgi:hypothetical protein
MLGFNRRLRSASCLRLFSTRLNKFNDHPNLNEFMSSLNARNENKALGGDMIPVAHTGEKGLKFHIETYGCQMNSSDSEIVRSILSSAGHETTGEITEADVILTNTCAIRENAEDKVWHRLTFFQSMRKKNKTKHIKSNYPVIGVLGCMAERLKDKLLLEESVDFVCGPDSYRDIPRFVARLFCFEFICCVDIGSAYKSLCLRYKPHDTYRF